MHLLPAQELAFILLVSSLTASLQFSLRMPNPTTFHISGTTTAYQPRVPLLLLYTVPLLLNTQRDPSTTGMFSLNTASVLLFRGLCTSYSICLERSSTSPRSPHEWILLIQVLFQMSPFLRHVL